MPAEGGSVGIQIVGGESIWMRAKRAEDTSRNCVAARRTQVAWLAGEGLGLEGFEVKFQQWRGCHSAGGARIAPAGDVVRGGTDVVACD